MRRLFLVLFSVGLIACVEQKPARTVAFDPANFPTGKTYYKDVLPLMQQHCMGCHTEGGIGPIQFDTPTAAAEQALNIAEHVYSREMPPWMPSLECGSFRNARTMSDEDIATFVGWYLDGAPSGLASDAPPPFTPPAGLSDPDLVLRMAAPYKPDETVDDDYRCFVFDPGLTSERDMTAFEVVPGDRRVVHHVLLYYVDRDQAMALDPEGDGYTCFGGPGLNDASVVGAWAPGGGVVQFPAGTGIRLATGRAMVMQIHYNLANGSFPDQSEIRYRFAPEPVAKVAQIVPGLNTTFAIPPGAEGYTASAERGAPFDVVVWGMAPHMHTLGRRALVEDAAGNCLLDIPAWDFHWQDFYFTSQQGGIPLKKGEKLKYTCTWDNPTANTVRWGESTSDEMCIAYFYISQP